MELAVCALSLNTWDAQWVNRQQLLSRIGRHHDVVYSKGAWFTWDCGTAEWQATPWFGSFTARDNVLVDHAPKLMLRSGTAIRWDRFVVSSHAARLQRAFRRRPEATRITYICHPSFLPYVQPLQGAKLVYHVYDLYRHQPSWNADLAAAEAIVLRAADLVFCPTKLMADELRRIVDRDIRILPNAADVVPIEAAYVSRAAAPLDISNIRRPRIGYIGSLHPHLDFDLLASVAERNPAWQFLMIGPELRTGELYASRGFRRCKGLSNIFFVGAKHRSEIPAYLVNMDVNILFYRAAADSWTTVGDPLKLHEYFASGRPVVSSDHPALRSYSDVIGFATDVSDWEAALSRAIDSGAPGSSETRRAIAAENSWDSRAETLRNWLEGLVRHPRET